MPTECERFLAESGVFEYSAFDVFSSNGIFDENKLIGHIQLRHDFIAKYGFAIINDEVVELLKGYQPILEVGAGSGYWSYELQQAGIDVITTDPMTGIYTHGVGMHRTSRHWENKYTKIEQLVAKKAIRKYPNRNLLTVWPDYDASWTHKMLRNFTGKYLIYVGEGSGGCTGSETFHEILDTEYTEVADLTIPQFDGLHDRLYIYQKK